MGRKTALDLSQGESLSAEGEGQSLSDPPGRVDRGGPGRAEGGRRLLAVGA